MELQDDMHLPPVEVEFHLKLLEQGQILLVATPVGQLKQESDKVTWVEVQDN